MCFKYLLSLYDDVRHLLLCIYCDVLHFYCNYCFDSFNVMLYNMIRILLGTGAGVWGGGGGGGKVIGNLVSS